MKNNIKNFNWKLKEEFDRVDALHWGHGFLVFLIILKELFYTEFTIQNFLMIPFFAGFYYLFNRTKKNLNYSFWTFAILLFIFLFRNLFINDFGTSSFYASLFALAILSVELYILSSPIYYPQFHWWEYDFRYKHDLKIRLELTKFCAEARLTDLRRGAGCILSFDNLGIGKQMTVLSFDQDYDFKFKVEVMSKRHSYFGRPVSYGVKFIFDTVEERKLFDQFCDFWKNERKTKQRKKINSWT